jgi:hypothetical protein
MHKNMLDSPPAPKGESQSLILSKLSITSVFVGSGSTFRGLGGCTENISE